MDHSSQSADKQRVPHMFDTLYQVVVFYFTGRRGKAQVMPSLEPKHENLRSRRVTCKLHIEQPALHFDRILPGRKVRRCACYLSHDPLVILSLLSSYLQQTGLAWDKRIVYGVAE